MKGDLVSIPEASYAPTSTEDAWLAGLLDALAPTLDLSGGGLVGMLLDATDTLPQMPQIQAVAHRELSEGALDAVLGAWTAPVSDAMPARFRRAGPASTVSRTLGMRLLRRQARASGVDTTGFPDAVYLLAGDPLGATCFICSPRRDIARVSPRTMRSLARAATHILTAHRLRRALGHAGPGPAAPTAAAVLDAHGRVHHAVGDVARDEDARAHLRRAVKDSERARGPMRRHAPDEALELWRALVDGRYCLVDHFDSDGRRYLIAHENALAAPGVRGLTDRERQVASLAALGHANKLIAYELGLAESSVGTYLARAMTKLGCSRRVELARILPGAASHASSDGPARDAGSELG